MVFVGGVPSSWFSGSSVKVHYGGVVEVCWSASSFAFFFLPSLASVVVLLWCPQVRVLAGGSVWEFGLAISIAGLDF